MNILGSEFPFIALHFSRIQIDNFEICLEKLIQGGINTKLPSHGWWIEQYGWDDGCSNT